MNQIMTFNDFIAEIAEGNLIIYVKSRYEGMYTAEEFDEEANNYMEGDFEIHLHYLIETWKNAIDEAFNDDFRIDYEYKGTYNELYDYYLETPCPEFEDSWLDDIFERKILDTNVCLK